MIFILEFIPILIYAGVLAVYIASLISYIKKDKARALNYFKGGSKILLIGIVVHVIIAIIMAVI